LFNEILDDGEINGYNSNENGSDCDDYIQLVLSGICKISDSDDGHDITICDDVQTGMERVFKKFFWIAYCNILCHPGKVT
jgi:hypothetical protein